MIDKRCAHHWRIAPAGQRWSAGTCLRCGEEREFDNAPLMQDEFTKSAQIRAERLRED